MRNFSVLVFLSFSLVTVSCSSISVAIRYGYPCMDDNKNGQKTLMNCTSQGQCPMNAYCHNSKKCMCLDGFLLSSNRTDSQCLRVATKLGDSCRENVQCGVTFTNQAECRDNVCVCSDGSHYNEEQRRCYQSVGIGQKCNTTHNCYVEGSSFFCVEGHCSCPLLHHPTADGKNCLKSSFLGQECSIDEECIAEHSWCNVTCGCQIDYVLSEDKKRCLKAANLIGDSCEENLQCESFLKNAKCGEDRKCTCVLDFKRRGSVCLRKINPDMVGKYCSTRAQCVKPIPETDLREEEVVNVDCLNGKCSCAQDYMLTEDKKDCIRFSENGAEKNTMVIWWLPIVMVSSLKKIVCNPLFFS